MTWMQRLKRVFNIEIERCEHCGGRVKVVACIEDPVVIDQILQHLGLMVSVPESDREARGPPVGGQDYSVSGSVSGHLASHQDTSLGEPV
jgi:hypothetical protein